MSLAERMRKEREGNTSGAVKVKPGVPGMASSASKKKAPVGMAVEEPASKSKNALRRERQRQAKERAAEAERLKAEEEAKKKAEDEAKNSAPVDPEKRAKKIKKLLKQIDELKSKDAGDLNEDQNAKIASEETLREELAGLAI